MARVDLFHPFNMLSFDSFGGNFKEFSSTSIYVANAQYQAYYYGNFSYNSFGEIFGTVNAVDLYDGNTLVLSANDLNASAFDVGYLIDRDQVQTAFDYMLAGRDSVFGSTGNDVIIGGAGNDDLFGGAGNDQFFPGSGINIVDGGSGLDTVFYQGNSQSYALSRTGDVFFVQGGNVADELRNVERVDFANQTLALDVGFQENAGMAYRIYQAAFDRAPDGAGLTFWIDAIDSGWSLLQVANGFIGSQEFRSVYGVNPSNEQFVDQLYQNVLGRPGEAQGFQFWVDELNTGTSRAFVLAGFSESAENIAGVAPVISDGFFYG
jgi:hypothetical protein